MSVTFDYCDECGPSVRAYVYVETPKGGELTFCGHHARKHEGVWKDQGIRIVSDFTYMLEGVK